MGGIFMTCRLTTEVNEEYNNYYTVIATTENCYTVLTLII